jgi:peptidoglycan hydrolase CwlO-like protein
MARRFCSSTRGRALAAALIGTTVLLAGASVSTGDLGTRAQSLRQGISSDSGQIQTYEGRLQSLQGRLSALQSSLDVQRGLLLRIRTQLASARAQLTELRGQLASDQRLLAAQLVAQYESPTADIVGVAIEAHGFANLLEQVDQMKQLATHNATVIARVKQEKARVTTLTAGLTEAQARQQRATSSVLVERDQIAAIKLTVLEHERVVAGARASKQAELNKVRHQLAVLQARAAAAQSASFAAPTPTAGGYSGGGFVSHGGDFGFFPAAGTDYSVGEEPEIAARLDALGKALNLHLIGISGYRSPQHSVEVGGFADDPHTRGEASDTPGVEGVSESTLAQFGLTRPFAGPAEADHIQLS